MDKVILAIRKGDATDIRSEMVSGIQRGRTRQKQIPKIVEELKANVKWKGLLKEHSVFKICSDKAEWNDEYLRNIGEAIVCGDVSEEILYHMIEVSEYVNRYYLAARKLGVLIICCAVILIVICFVL